MAFESNGLLGPVTSMSSAFGGSFEPNGLLSGPADNGIDDVVTVQDMGLSSAIDALFSTSRGQFVTPSVSMNHFTHASNK